MALHSGARIGPYEVTSQIGAGGMGEVYRATDTSLGRQVAIKVLPEAFAQEPDRLARFEREAKTLASLNHPNIAQIYGLEKANGIRALVMELVEGPTLADRIAQGPMPLDEALPIAKQIAEALEAAHEQGIIHRDLKPANIKVRPDGTVKVLDFGLAKALESTGTMSPNVSQSPTITSPAMMTGVGVLLGTAAYMSPEQARGKTADRRSDIWAFGCVLFEVLTGQKVFERETLTDTLAAIVSKEPDWRALPLAIPSAVHLLLRRCLRKDPARRLQHIGDARVEIGDAIIEPAIVDVRPPGGGRVMRAVPWIFTGALVVGLVLIQLYGRPNVVSETPTMRLELNLPPGVELYKENPQIAFSRDGARVAFPGVSSGVRRVYLRRLDQADVIPVAGTETVQVCFFSPDGSAIAFITSDRSLKKLTLADGLVVTLANDANYFGGAWGIDDRITFARPSGLWQVPAAGGSPTQLTTLDPQKGEVMHAWPEPVADGKIVLFGSLTGTRRDPPHIEALTVATGERRVVLDVGIAPIYTQSGHLLFVRDDALLAVPFDVTRLEVTGAPTRVVESVGISAGAIGSPSVAVSDTGTLIYGSVSNASRLLWVSRQGSERPITEARRRYQYPRIAPDGRSVVVQVAGDLWIQDIARTTLTRVTSEDTAGNSYHIWMPNGKRLVFRTITGIRWSDADGSGRSGVVAGTSVNDLPTSVSPNGEWLAFNRQTGEESGSDIYLLSLQGEPEPRPLIATPSFEGGAQFSPNGRWIAYASIESGQSQVYVRPFPGPDRRWLVSPQGGTQPLWSKDGRELFYRTGETIMAVDVTTTPDLALSEPRLVVEGQYAYQGLSIASYDISSDGQQFVVVKDDPEAGRLNVVLNWLEELKRLVPTN